MQNALQVISNQGEIACCNLVSQQVYPGFPYPTICISFSAKVRLATCLKHDAGCDVAADAMSRLEKTDAHSMHGVCICSYCFFITPLHSCNAVSPDLLEPTPLKDCDAVFGLNLFHHCFTYSIQLVLVLFVSRKASFATLNHYEMARAFLISETGCE